MRNVEIPGGSATIRDREDILTRHRTLLRATAFVAASAIAKIPRKPGEKPGDPDEVDWDNADKVGLTYTDTAAIMALEDAAIVALLESWTLPAPLPTLDTVQDLAPKLYDALSEAVRRDAVTAVAEVDFGPTDPKAEGFSETPTQPSGD
jgi:hypothetical protein